MLALLVFVSGSLVAATTPLTEEQRIAIETARDGYDQREQAFAMLLENARSWTPGNQIPGSQTPGSQTPESQTPGMETQGEAVLARPDDAAVVERPDEFRGRLFELEGVIQQQMRLANPEEGVMEWFIRTDNGVPLVIYMDEKALGEPWRDGQRVRMLARFYKVIELTARDGVARQYSAFVGGFPAAISPHPPSPPPPEGRGSAVTSRPPTSFRGLVTVLLIMIVIFVIAALVARSKRRPTRDGRIAINGPGVDEAGSLPDDPAQALAELRRRSEAQS